MIRPQTVSRYASMVKFSHTIFAMPFALVGYAYALQTTDAEFSLLLLVKVLLAMVFARNTAMGFNRYADRRIDALNPRTRNREIPAGVITPRRALIFVIVNAALFLAVALWINRLAFFLSPAALLVLMGMEQYRRQPMVQILCILAGCGVTWLIQSDFWVIGILLPVIFYWFRNEPLFMAIGGGILSAVDSAYFYGSAVLAYIPILLYNGKRGNWHIKYFFYVFYPLQFLLLYLVRLWLTHGQWFAGFLEKSIR